MRTIDRILILHRNLSMMNRRFTTAAALLPVLLSLPAVASERAIEEVIVTAQKREQNLQDVSISVTAFGEGAL